MQEDCLRCFIFIETKGRGETNIVVKPARQVGHAMQTFPCL